MLRGAVEVERTPHGLLPHRLPASARRQFPDDQLAMAEAQPSGVRLVFRTRATTVELDALPTKRAYVGAPLPRTACTTCWSTGSSPARPPCPAGGSA